MRSAARAAWAALACAAALASADPRDDIASAMRRAADASVPVAERRAAAERAQTLRDALLDTLPEGDAARAALLVDSAWAHLAALGWDATDTAVLLGMPTDEQIERARTAVREASGALGAARNEDWSMRPPRELADLADATARTLLLAAATDASAARRIELASAAVRAAETAPEVGVGAERAASLSTHLGLALARRGQPGDAARARATLDAVIESDRAWPITRVEAKLGGIAGARTPAAWRTQAERLRAALGDDPFTRSGMSDPLLVLRAVEAVAAAGRVAARTARGDDAAVLAAETLAWPIDLMLREDLGLTPGQRRALAQPIIARLARPTIGTPGAERALPDEAIDALALLDDLTDAERRLLLAAALERAMPEAAWRLLAPMAESDDPAMLMTAADAARQLSRDDPAQAERGMRTALALLRDLDDRFVPGARERYVAALEEAARRGLAARDDGLWRLERARLIASRVAGLDADELAEAVTLATAARGETLPDAAQLVRALAPIADARFAREQDAAGEGALTVGADRIAMWRDAMSILARAGTNDPDLRHRFAAALLERGSREDLAEAATLIDPERDPLLHGRLLLAQRQIEYAARVLADAVPETPRSRREWAAWTALLEATAETEPGRVRAHAARLSSIDAELGGEPWASRIRAAAE